MERGKGSQQGKGGRDLREEGEDLRRGKGLRGKEGKDLNRKRGAQILEGKGGKGTIPKGRK